MALPLAIIPLLRGSSLSDQAAPRDQWSGGGRDLIASASPSPAAVQSFGSRAAPTQNTALVTVAHSRLPRISRERMGMPTRNRLASRCRPAVCVRQGGHQQGDG
jgi:hypothetical protein